MDSHPVIEDTSKKVGQFNGLLTLTGGITLPASKMLTEPYRGGDDESLIGSRCRARSRRVRSVKVLIPTIPKATPMDKLLAPHTPEAAAHYHLTENSFTWHTDQPSVDESLIAGCASYRAFERYLEGNDLFLLPRTRGELESILRRYSYDAIHNAVSSSRSPLQTGGYSRICHLAEKSIRDVLSTGENTNILLALHHPNVPTTNHESEECNMTRPIATG